VKAKLHHFLNISKSGSFLLVTLILLSITLFALQTEYKNSTALEIACVFIAAIFACEYCARIWTANYNSAQSENARLAYIFSFHGLIDLLAFLPALFIPAANGSLILRLLRLSRLLQIMKIKAVTRGLKRFGLALKNSRIELGITLSLSMGFIFIGAVIMYFIEGESQPEAFGSIPRALWWSMATLTTVGYGDVYPITVLGKCTAAFIAMVGIAAVAMPAGILAAAFSKAHPH